MARRCCFLSNPSVGVRGRHIPYAVSASGRGDELMVIVGLTGSIGMGKSTAARMLRQMGVPVYDADAAVHALQAKGGTALPPIEAAFPGVVKEGVLDRQALGARVFGNAEALRRLESVVHPPVRQR